jgi:hypothetical protein
MSNIEKVGRTHGIFLRLKHDHGRLLPEVCMRYSIFSGDCYINIAFIHFFSVLFSFLVEIIRIEPIMV